METSKSSQAGNSEINMSCSSIKVLIFFKMDSILSSGLRTTSQEKFLSGTVSVTFRGMTEGGGR